MNAGIITIYNLSNYGNRLQNYAVRSTLNKLGVEAVTLIPRQIKMSYRTNQKMRELKEFLSKEPEKAGLSDPDGVRQLRFRMFNEDNIPIKELDTVAFGPELNEQYDFFVTGSDQVWNPTFKSSKGIVKNYLLSFASPNKRISFSPSFGSDEIPDEWKPLFEKELDKFTRLSVREDSGAGLVRKLTGRVPEVLMDPTLMISKEEWEGLAKPLYGADYRNEKYVLYYFIGDKKEEMPKQVKAVVDKFIAENNMKEYNLFDKDNPIMNSAGPAEFIDLINNASLICTDSFHGTVFSIIFNKPFVLCDRELILNNEKVDMSSRIKTLLGRLQLRDRLPENFSDRNIVEADYSEAKNILELEKTRTYDFLKKSMGLS